MKKSFYILTLAILFVGCSKEDKSASKLDNKASAGTTRIELTPDQIQTIALTTTHISRMALSGAVHVNGHLDVPPQNLVSVSAPFGGFLKNTNMLEGKRVKAGEVVAVMENAEYIQLQQDYLELSSKGQLAKVELERQEALAKENVNAQKSLQQAKADYETIEARTAGLKAKLRMINIDPAKLQAGKDLGSTINLLAPINGYVTEINANIGKYVSPTDVIMKIVDSEHLHAELIVFEKDVMKLKVGQKVRFVLANETSARMATVHLVGREINEHRTVQVHCHLDDEDANLLPGMFLSADVETGTEQADVLPSKAVVEYEGQKYVFAARSETTSGNQVFEMIAATTGVEQNGFVEVNFPGMTEDVMIVVDGAFDLLGSVKNTAGED
ncbi:MAG TPA: efflux RND transporter periplasmic adaptor subunit [Cyclobacteriaceae bacterium]|nr:efflux RND transporter periplasmic adaptor subunit [Cyclobacteriaceae bacterium]